MVDLSDTEGKPAMTWLRVIRAGGPAQGSDLSIGVRHRAARGQRPRRRRGHGVRGATHRALANAKDKGTKYAAPFLQNLSLDTKFGELGYFRGKGCDTCAGTGMKGRAGVYEVMMLTPTLRKCIMQNSGAPELRDAAVGEGMLTLRMDAWLKVMKGNTTYGADDSRNGRLAFA